MSSKIFYLALAFNIIGGTVAGTKVKNIVHDFSISYTVESLFVAAATIEIDEFFAQNLLSKNCVLLRLLFKGGYYLRAATNKDFTVDGIPRFMKLQNRFWM